MSISGAVRKFGHFEEGTSKETDQAEEENLWNLLPVYASFVSFTDPTEVCSLWRIYSAIVTEYLEVAASPENYHGATSASTSSSIHHSRNNNAARATAGRGGTGGSGSASFAGLGGDPHGLFADHASFDHPNLALCYLQMRELADEFIGVRRCGWCWVVGASRDYRGVPWWAGMSSRAVGQEGQTVGRSGRKMVGVEKDVFGEPRSRARGGETFASDFVTN
jgi:hypothetical protein